MNVLVVFHDLIHVDPERLFRHLSGSCQYDIFVETLRTCLVSSLLPENWHRSSYRDEGVNEFSNAQYLLCFAEVSDVAIVIQASDIHSGSCPQMLAPRKQNNLDVVNTKGLYDVSYMPLDYRSVPFYRNIVFLEAL